MAKSKDVQTHAEIARKGGIIRAERLNPDRRREIASRGGKASAEKKRAKNKTK